MSKVLVETTGEFFLFDREGDQEVEAFRPSVVQMTEFMEQRMALKQIKILGPLSDKATEEGFAKAWKDAGGDRKVIKTFLTDFAEGKAEKPADKPADTKPAT